MGTVVKAAPQRTAAAGCMKCGFCMSVCPVYRVDHMESHVARGRNMLICMAAEGDRAAEEGLDAVLDTCLLCGRCMAVCPARVPSAEINVQMRGNRFLRHGPSLAQRLVYRGILNHRHLMACLVEAASMLPGTSREAGQPLRHMADFTAVLSGGISLPRITRPVLSKRIKDTLRPPPNAVSRGKVAFFAGCAFAYFLSDVGFDTATALTGMGFEVVYPREQTCCGMAVRNAGDVETARRMAARNVEALAGFDQVVTGCATCGSTLKGYGQWFCEDDPLKAAATALSVKVFDFSEFIVTKGFQPSRGPKQTVRATYHDPCHLKWHQGLSAPPRTILKALNGVDYVEMPGADACCGLGGSFGLKHRSASLAIQARKMAAVRRSGARTLVTACPGCMLQLMDGVRRHHLDVEVVHISRLVRERT
jgi:Fe-S oxidoreductase